MFVVGVPYVASRKSSNRAHPGRISVIPNKDIMSIIIDGAEDPHWTYGIYNVKVTTKDKKGHPIQLLRPVSEVSRKFYMLMSNIHRAEEYGDGRALYTYTQVASKLATTRNLNASVYEIVSFFCYLFARGVKEDIICEAIDTAMSPGKRKGVNASVCDIA